MGKFEEAMQDIRAHPLQERQQFVTNLGNQLQAHSAFRDDCPRILSMIESRLGISN